MIPAAFFKSIGYGAVATLLGGALTGCPLGWSMGHTGGARMVGMVLAIDGETVVPAAVFGAGVGSACEGYPGLLSADAGGR